MKYIIRFIGSICILAAVALLFFSPIVEIDGVKNKDFQTMYSQFEKVSTQQGDWLISAVEQSNSSVKEELREYDLPYRKSELKTWFRNINGLVKETLNRSITLEEVFNLVWNVPGLVEDLENLVQTDSLLEKGINGMVISYDEEAFDIYEILEKAEGYFDVIRRASYLVIGLFAVLTLLVVAAVIGNMLNKGRGIKYAVLVIVTAMTVGCYIGVPSLSTLLSEAVSEIEPFGDMKLYTTAVPILACVLLIIPAVLDFWNKKRAEQALKNGRVFDEPVVPAPMVQALFVKEEETAGQVDVAENSQTVQIETIADDAVLTEPVRKENIPDQKA